MMDNLSQANCVSLSIMRAAELGIQLTESPRGPVPKRVTTEYMTDPTIMAEMLYRTELVSDEDFTELVDQIGSRAARLILRAKALQGDVKALDLYFRIIKESKASRRKPTPAAGSSASSFVQEVRVVDKDVDE